jgi:outer membrane protein assembly factor BamB
MGTIEDSASRRNLRLWPGVTILVIQWLIRFIVPAVSPENAIIGVLAGLAGTVLILLWWLVFSRAPWIERIGAVVLMIAAIAAVRPLLHKSISAGMMGNMYFLYALPPLLSLALVGWAVASRGFGVVSRWASLAAAFLLACGFWTVLRTDGVTGAGAPQLAWRWSKTHEDTLPARIVEESPAAASPAPAAPKAEPSLPAKVLDKTVPPPPAPAAPAQDTRVLWPGFRGPARDNVIRGVRIQADWQTSPPVELWRRPVGPGWSSFAAGAELIYTQEQRGDAEIVSCYRLTSGKPVWSHRETARFWDSEGGPGPRATPALSDGRVFSFGATGILNALDARTGSVLWSRNAASENGKKPPGWGFSGSPLVVDGVVVVALSGSLAGYDAATGKPQWLYKSRGGSYSSPHLATIGGVVQVLLINGSGLISVSPSDGKPVWEYAWEGAPIVQPASLAEGGLLVTTASMTGSLGMRRLKVDKGAAGWTVEERWTSQGLKPYFNDFVVHNGHAYGFDGSILSCIAIEDGKRKWKGGRYGNGQMVLLADQDLLLVLSEEGELALVKALPDQFTEVARYRAIEGKTWNHPVLAGDTLLVRNGEEMAAFRLSFDRR